jgi:hypothetical protein
MTTTLGLEISRAEVLQSRVHSVTHEQLTAPIYAVSLRTGSYKQDSLVNKLQN